MQVRVFSWNLLSTRLASPWYHVHCKPEHLDTQTRQSKVELVLLEEMSQHSIICLQELSEEWLSFLIPKFNDHNYVFIYDSQWLGVGIAFPRSEYTLQGCVFESVGEELSKKCVKAEFTRTQTMLSFAGSTFRWLWNKLPRFMVKYRPEPEDVWQIAVKKTNRFVGVTLCSTQSRLVFNIFGYHIPCEFRRNDVMNIHAAGLLSRIQTLSGKLPYILAGDFNSTPDSSVYRLITRNIIPSFPTSRMYCMLPMLKDRYYTPLTSAYAYVRGKEPLFTNLGWTKDSPTAFKDCIDYIFSSNGFIVDNVTAIPSVLAEDTESLPDADHPSDHLPLQATFSFLYVQ